jgi:hypothetical protein
MEAILCDRCCQVLDGLSLSQGFERRCVVKGALYARIQIQVAGLLSVNGNPRRMDLCGGCFHAVLSEAGIIIQEENLPEKAGANAPTRTPEQLRILAPLNNDGTCQCCEACLSHEGDEHDPRCEWVAILAKAG